MAKGGGCAEQDLQELLHLAQMADSDDEDDYDEVEASGAVIPIRPAATIPTPAIIAGAPPTKPSKPPGKPALKAYKDDDSDDDGTSVGRGAQHKAVGLGEVRMQQQFLDHADRKSDGGGSRQRGSVLEEILRESKQVVQQRGVMLGGSSSISGSGFGSSRVSSYDTLADVGTEGRGFGGGFSYQDESDSHFSEIDNFGSSAPVVADSKFASSRSSSVEGQITRGSLMGGVQSVEDRYGPTRAWLTRPCPKKEPALLCYVEREKGLFSIQTVFRCYMEPTPGQSTGRFLMSAKKKPGKQASYYLVSMDPNPDGDRGSEALLGKVRANAVGSQYTITDHGLAPDRTQAPSTLRKELALLRFRFDSGGPSQMEVWIPQVSGSTSAVWQPMKEADGIEAAIGAQPQRLDKLTVLQNKHPKWDASHGGHVLNFEGRVTECSVKNFQIHTRYPDPSDVVNLQFGRVGKNKFVMDVRYPLSPVQAFGICVACLDGKIADRKGYEYIRKMTGL